jgi:hypothetical protein
MRILLFLVYGFMPLWVSIAYVIAGAVRHPGGHDYWATAPWIVIIFAPFSLVTIGFAAFILHMYAKSEGDLPRDLRSARATLLILVGGSVYAAIYLWRLSPP